MSLSTRRATCMNVDLRTPLNLPVCLISLAFRRRKGSTSVRPSWWPSSRRRRRSPSTVACRAVARSITRGRMLHASDGAVAEMDLEDALALSSLSTFDRSVVAGAIVERRLAMADERGGRGRRRRGGHRRFGWPPHLPREGAASLGRPGGHHGRRRDREVGGLDRGGERGHVRASFVYEAREPSTSGVCEHATCASGTRVESECPMSMYQRRAEGLRVTELRDGVCRVSCVSCAV